MRGFLIAGTASGVGKTTVTLALLASMRRRHLVVQPFKGGPDFLDTGHQTRIAGRTARNIDTWMLSIDANQDVLREAARGAQAVIVEGMMGLFDGKDGGTQRGSSAEIAKLFKLPVVLVLDAAKTSQSIAATVLGFELFDPALKLAGVILNRVASERHFAMLRESIVSSCRTPVLGWLPQEPSIAISERHLGLRTSDEHYGDGGEHKIERLSALAEKHLDLDTLLSLDCGFDFEQDQPTSYVPETPGLRIGVAKDNAFSFYYEDNLDLLRKNGAETVSFSPIHDASLPEDLDALYLGGGYPELYARELSTNEPMLKSVRGFASSGRPVYAECGGMIYLSKSITTTDGAVFEFAGVLPFSTEMTNKAVQFGYVTVELTRDCLLGAAGTVVRGHSFHYSRITEAPDTKTCYRVQYSLSKREENEGYLVSNVLASYIHIHFRTSPRLAYHFVELARSVKKHEGVVA